MNQTRKAYDDVKVSTGIKSKLPLIIAGIIAILILIFGANAWYNSRKSSIPQYNYTGFITNTDPKFGPGDARVKVVIMEDYYCHVCRDFNPTLNETEPQYPDVQFVYKPVDILGSSAVIPYALATYNQGKFLEFNTLAYSKMTELSTNRAQTLQEIGGELTDFDVVKWRTDRNDATLKVKADWNMNDIKNTLWPQVGHATEEKPVGQALPGTPTVVILKDNQIRDWWSGRVETDELKSRIDAVKAS